MPTRRTNPFLVKNNVTREVVQDLKTLTYRAANEGWRGFGMFVEDGHMKLRFVLSGTMKYNPHKANTAAERLRQMIFNSIRDGEDVE